jgi:hypothetical protein
MKKKKVSDVYINLDGNVEVTGGEQNEVFTLLGYAFRGVN